jgi:hypothetical protein
VAGGHLRRPGGACGVGQARSTRQDLGTHRENGKRSRQPARPGQCPTWAFCAPDNVGRLHDDPGNAQAGEVIDQPQHRPGQRRVGLHLLQSPPRMVLIGDPDAAHQLRLADVQRRDPLDDLLVVLRRDERPWPPRMIGVTAARRSQGHKWRNLILVLEATLNGPRSGSRRPAEHGYERRPVPKAGLRAEGSG